MTEDDKKLIETSVEVIQGLNYLNEKKHLLTAEELEDELGKELRDLASLCVDILADMEAVHKKAESDGVNG